MSKTTAAAAVTGLAFLGLTAAFIFGKIDVSGYGAALGATGTLAAMVIGKLAMDDKNTPGS
jgi:ribose/xylose/arabinose/galactoside ABC-type transport system permease subunit